MEFFERLGLRSHLSFSGLARGLPRQQGDLHDEEISIFALLYNHQVASVCKLQYDNNYIYCRFCKIQVSMLYIMADPFCLKVTFLDILLE